MKNNSGREHSANVTRRKNSDRQPQNTGGFEGMNFEQQRDSYKGNNNSPKGGKKNDDTGGGNNSGKRRDNN
ncbi:MAG: hypothetical protein ABR502_10820 [Chitinophagaceae bacterium]